MLLSINTNAVVTISQVILSCVIVELRVVAASLGKFASEPMKASRAKCRQWQAAMFHSMAHAYAWQHSPRHPRRLQLATPWTHCSIIGNRRCGS